MGKLLTCLPRLSLAHVRLTFCSLFAGWWYSGKWRLSVNRELPDLLQHSVLRARSCSKFPIALMGKLLTCLPRLTLAHMQTLWSTIQGVRATETLKMSHCPPATPANFPSPPMGNSRFARWLQGGGVAVFGGTVAISSCTISGNTATNVRAHVQKFPSPQWDALLLCPPL